MRTALEISIQRKLHKRLFGQISYTLARSEFTDGSGAYRPSSWDRRHVASVNIEWKLPKSWDIGGRIGYASGSPYTPYDLATSSLIDVYDALGEGVLDYTQLNAVHGLLLATSWISESISVGILSRGV